MTGRRPVWLAADASPALAVRRPLGEIARPAAGRAMKREVEFAAVPSPLAEAGGWSLAAALGIKVGPALRGRVVVEAHFTHDSVARGLSTPLLADVPVARLNHALAMYDAAVAQLGSAVLLVASCYVLWPQTQAQEGLS